MAVLFLLVFELVVFTHYDDTNYRAVCFGVCIGYYFNMAARWAILKN